MLPHSGVYPDLVTVVDETLLSGQKGTNPLLRSPSNLEDEVMQIKLLQENGEFH